MTLSIIGMTLGHCFWIWWLTYEYQRSKGRKTKRWWERRLF